MSGIDILFNTHVGALTEGQLQLQALIEAASVTFDELGRLGQISPTAAS